MNSAIAQLIGGRERDLGGFTVRRILPAAERQMVGPFIFLDAMGPATFPAGLGVDVRPHPHIGLATVTWLFEGELLHRDSLGFRQRIRPGDVNWMTAGRGIAHSERTPADLRSAPARLHGMQSWVALPRTAEEVEPEFHHHAADSIPRREDGGACIHLIAGTLFGLASPVRTFSQMGYAMVDLAAGARLTLEPEHEERAVYPVSGALQIGGQVVEPGQLAVLAPGTGVPLDARSEVRCMVLAGEAADGPRHLWWNFVSSSTERIEQAKRDWQAGRFGPVAEETEFIPLPEKS